MRGNRLGLPGGRSAAAYVYLVVSSSGLTLAPPVLALSTVN
jgi:hypothetical protein